MSLGLRMSLGAGLSGQYSASGATAVPFHRQGGWCLEGAQAIDISSFPPDSDPAWERSTQYLVMTKRTQAARTVSRIAVQANGDE